MYVKKWKGTFKMSRPKRHFGDYEDATGFFDKYPNDRLRISSLMHLYSGIRQGVSANAPVRARAADGSLVPVCIEYEAGVLVITKDD